MSFILDALKKSEREREQQAQGTQPSVIYRRSHTPPTWMVVVITLLLVNMALVTVVWLRNDHQPAVPMITVNNGAPATPAAVRVPANSLNNSNSNNELRSLQDETQSRPDPQDITATLLADAAPPEGPPLVRQVNPDDAGKSGLNNNIRNYARDTGAGSNVPTLDSIGGNAALNLPALHLDIHVYSLNATERFVFINMKKYAEGNTLKEGPVIDRITSDGAVLSYGGQQFLLPRQ